jgi:hypothetical protein
VKVAEFRSPPTGHISIWKLGFESAVKLGGLLIVQAKALVAAMVYPDAPWLSIAVGLLPVTSDPGTSKL